jgi:hypothetical protein
MFWKRKELKGVQNQGPSFVETLSSSESFKHAFTYEDRIQGVHKTQDGSVFSDEELALAVAVFSGHGFDPSFVRHFKRSKNTPNPSLTIPRFGWKASSLKIGDVSPHPKFDHSEDEESDAHDIGSDELGPIVLGSNFLEDIIRLHACLATGAEPPVRLRRMREALELALQSALDASAFQSTYGLLDEQGNLELLAQENAIAISGSSIANKNKAPCIFIGNLDISSLNSSINIFLFDIAIINGKFNELGEFSPKFTSIYAYDMNVKSLTLSNIDAGIRSLGKDYSELVVDKSQLSGDLIVNEARVSSISLRHCIVGGQLIADISQARDSVFEDILSPRHQKKKTKDESDRKESPEKNSKRSPVNDRLSKSPPKLRIDLSHARIDGLLCLAGKNSDADVFLDNCRCEVFDDPGLGYCKTLHIEGFEYRWLRTSQPGHFPLEKRVEWLDMQPDHFKRGRYFLPQPWDQLATTFKRMGRFKLAYQVQMIKEARIHEALGPDHIASSAGKPFASAWNARFIPTALMILMLIPLLVGLGLQTYAPDGTNWRSSWSLIAGLAGSIALAWIMIALQTLSQKAGKRPQRSTLIWGFAFAARWLTEWGYGLRRLAVASLVVWMASASFFQLAYLHGHMSAEGRVAALQDLMNTAAGSITYTQSELAAQTETLTDQGSAIEIVSRPVDPARLGLVCPVQTGENELAADAPSYVTQFNGALYALDTLIPVLDLGQEKDWTPTTQPGCTQEQANWLSVAPFIRVLLIAFGWLVTSLLISALTGIIRRDQVN